MKTMKIEHNDDNSITIRPDIRVEKVEQEKFFVIYRNGDGSKRLWIEEDTQDEAERRIDVLMPGMSGEIVGPITRVEEKEVRGKLKVESGFITAHYSEYRTFSQESAEEAARNRRSVPAPLIYEEPAMTDSAPVIHDDFERPEPKGTGTSMNIWKPEYEPEPGKVYALDPIRPADRESLDEPESDEPEPEHLVEHKGYGGIAKYRHYLFPNHWFLTDFTMAQLEGRLAFLESGRKDSTPNDPGADTKEEEDILKTIDEFTSKRDARPNPLASAISAYNILFKARDEIMRLRELCKKSKPEPAATENDDILTHIRNISNLIKDASDNGDKDEAHNLLWRLYGYTLKAADKINRLRLKNDDLHGEIDSLKYELKDAKEKLMVLQGREHVANIVRKRHDTEMKGLEQERDSLRLELSRHDAMEVAHNNLKSELTHVLRERDSLKDEVTRIRGISDAHEQHGLWAERRIEELEGERDSIKAELDATKENGSGGYWLDQFRRMRDKNEEAAEAHRIVKGRCNKLENELSRLKKQKRALSDGVLRIAKDGRECRAELARRDKESFEAWMTPHGMHNIQTNEFGCSEFISPSTTVMFTKRVLVTPMEE
jgi:hypothetical protein